MRISIIGAGYVGLVTGACLSDLGHDVLVMDINEEKIKQLQKDIIPIHEPGLDRLIHKNALDGRLNFTTDIKEAVRHASIHFICVWTPPGKDGRADLSAVRQVGRELAKNFYKNEKYIVVIKSTVPVGAGRELGRIIRRQFKGELAMVSNPEFLREGQAIADMMHPDRIVAGSDNEAAALEIVSLYSDIRGGERIITDLATSEMIKYAANAFLATKISFINEVANVCERVGADVTVVARGIGTDKRIGHSFLRAGMGYGGSCFPKDVRALQQFANHKGYDFKLLKSVIEVNEQQRQVIIDKLIKNLKKLKNKNILVLGLAFKSNTDDVRESAAIDIINKLHGHGANIRAYDPVALDNSRRVIDKKVDYLLHPHHGIKDLDAIIVATEWPEFKDLDWAMIKIKMRKPLIIDGRNLLDPQLMKSLGFLYEGIGR